MVGRPRSTSSAPAHVGCPLMVCVSVSGVWFRYRVWMCASRGYSSSSHACSMHTSCQVHSIGTVVVSRMYGITWSVACMVVTWSVVCMGDS